MPGAFNACTWLLDRHVLAGDGDRVAVVCGGRDTTYRELRDLTAAVAASLRALGMRREERVVLCMTDGVELLAGILGALRAGLVAVPVSTMLTGPELETLLGDSGARLLAVSAEVAAAAGTALLGAGAVADVVLAGEGELAVPQGVRAHGWDDFLAAGVGTDGTPATTTEDAPGLWLYTSGTTGAPKAAMHRHANLRHVCTTYAEHVLGVGPDDRCLSVAKMFFAYGLGNSALFPLAVGARTVLDPRRPTPETVAGLLRAQRPTLFFGVPSFYAALLAADLPADLFTGVRACVSAGEALPAPLLARFTDRFGLDILDGIGSTEALHIFLSNSPGDVGPGTTGRPVPGYRVELRDTEGLPVPQGTPGTLFVRGESLADGYWCRTATTRAVFQGEWLCTGDTYVQDGDDRYVCLGRTSEMLKAGGIWVSPAEVEQRLVQHPAVMEAGVVGVPDADGLDKPVACIVLRDGAAVGAEELVAFCRAGLAAFKRPRAVVVVDALPRTATGKLQRFKVRELATAALVPAVPAAAPSAQPVQAAVH